MPHVTTKAPLRDTSPEIRARHAAEGDWSGVDEMTEILTKRGWLTVHDVRVGDQAWALNPTLGTAGWEAITSVTIGEPKPRLLRHTELGGFSMLATHALEMPTMVEDRNWRTEASYHHRRYRVDKMPKNGRLYRAVAKTSENEKIWSDAFVELVAWYWCEGHKGARSVGRSDTAIISQSSTVNSEYCQAIERALHEFAPGQYSSYVRREDGQRRFSLRVVPSGALFRVTGLDKAPHSWFLTELTQTQLKLLINTCLKGDGSVNKGNGGQRVWYQLSHYGMGQFQMACALAGVATNAHISSDYGNRYGQPPVAVTLLKNSFATPWMSVHVKSYGYKPGPARTSATDEWADHQGLIWNVSTAPQTWMARRRWAIYFTGCGEASVSSVGATAVAS